MPTIHRFACQAFTDAVVLNVYPQFRDRSVYTTWGEWGEEFGRFWSRCHGKYLPDIPQTGFKYSYDSPSLPLNWRSIFCGIPPFYTILTITDPH